MSNEVYGTPASGILPPLELNLAAVSRSSWPWDAVPRKLQFAFDDAL